MKRQRLVLAGGGHAHALVLRQWAMQPEPDTELVLISNESLAAYSDLLPAFVAGLCDYLDMQIDLRRLCTAVGATFVHAEVIGIDVLRRSLLLREARPPYYDIAPISFDVLSINLGSRPAFHGVLGASQWAVPVKPVPTFLAAWQTCLDEINQQPRRLAIVGGGAGGIELAMAMRERCGDRVHIDLIHAGPALMAQQGPRLGSRLFATLGAQGINVHLQSRVEKVESGLLQLCSGKRLEFDKLFWVTDAAAPAWFGSTGFELDEKGFLRVNDSLMLCGQQGIFAVGDCASVLGQSRPKSGVFAVRQAKPLFDNLRRYITGRPLRPVRLQSKYLALIGSGNGRAIALRGRWHAEGRVFWQLKQVIDKRFMRKFSEVPAKPAMKVLPTTESKATLMRCLGCGAKVGAHVLSDVLAEISRLYPDCLLGEAAGIEWGLAEREDVSLWQPTAGQKILQSLDYFPSLVDDAFIAGRLACLHAFSDIIAKGARPHSALVLAVLTAAAEHLQRDQLFRLLAGIAHELRTLGAFLSGGHTAEGDIMAIGLAVNGVSDGRILRKDGGQVGDYLILTKALGTGVLFAAAMQGKAKAHWLDQALASMLYFAPGLLPLLQNSFINAATDITGFGLIGHLVEMLRLGELSAQLDSTAIPILAGASEMAAAGIMSSLYPANSRFEALLDRESLPLENWPLWGDPQTSGGLLLSISPAGASTVLGSLQQMGYRHAAIIGRLESKKGSSQVRFTS